MTKIKVYSKALDTSITTERVIGEITGKQPGPTLIFMGGIHGNEPAGVFAAFRMLDKLKDLKDHINGNIVCLAGNLQALKTNQRFINEDLNRIWSRDRVGLIPENVDEASHEEEAEQVEVYHLIRNILKTHNGPFYFFDIHTTSSETLPFLTVNDSLLNRTYTDQYPIPTILGIEEYLDGPILSYINELGYVAFGFEAGQHDDLASIENAEAFCFLSLVYTGAIDRELIEFHHYYDLLAKYTDNTKHIFEIYYRYLIQENEDFKMEPGFYNFQKIRKEQLLAHSNEQPIISKSNGRIFMPLYQSLGIEGFFTIREIRKVFLNLSAKLRSYKMDTLLVWLPGIRWLDEKRSGLIINKTIAKFLAKQILHLLGYRSKERGEQHLIAYNREAKSRTSEYLNTPWMKDKR